MKYFIILSILITSVTFAQTEYGKWGKGNYSYAIKPDESKRDYSFNSDNIPVFVIKSLLNSYWFFISDVDGDNCPFSPTCSSFFLQAVQSTNFIQGSLMFFDRFTRDMDFFEKDRRYPSVEDGHYYDPISLYTLNKNEIKYLPPSIIVK